MLDVRRDEERRAWQVAGALPVPLDELRQRLDEIPAPPVEVWVHCQAAGYRAAIAASILGAAAPPGGHLQGRHAVSACPLTMMLVRSGRQAVNVEGGISAWMRAGLPVVTRHGRPGRVVKSKAVSTCYPDEIGRADRFDSRLDRRQPPHKRNEAP